MAPNYAELIKRNEEYAVTHESLPLIAEIQAGGAPPPKTCIVTCIDPRVFPEKILGLQIGEAFIFRTVAGRPQAVIQEIIAIDRVSKEFEDLILLYHTDCGATLFTHSWVRAELAQVCASGAARFDGIDFGAVETSIEQRLRDDIEWLKAHSLMPESLVKAMKGYMYDLKTGKLHRVA